MLNYLCVQIDFTSLHKSEVKQFKGKDSMHFLCSCINRVKHHSLHFEWSLKWLFKGVAVISLVQRGFKKNHLKRCHFQSKRVEDHSKKSCPSYGSSKSAFSLEFREFVKTHSVYDKIRNVCLKKGQGGQNQAKYSSLYNVYMECFRQEIYYFCSESKFYYEVHSTKSCGLKE